MKKSFAIVIVAAGGALALIATTRPDLGATTAPSTMVTPGTRAALPFESSRGNGNGNYRRSQRRNGYQGRNGYPTATGVPAGFEVVATRNLFVRGQQYVNPEAAPPTPPQQYIPGSGVTPPTMLVFTGVMLTDVGRVAFLENQEEGRVDRVQVGDSVSNGKVTAINLDTLEFKDSGGHVSQIQIGNNLAGGSAWGVSGAPSITASTATSQPSTDSSGNESILEKLRKRRQQELGGK